MIALAASVGALVATAGLIWAGGGAGRAVIRRAGLASPPTHDTPAWRPRCVAFLSRHVRRDRAAEAAQWVVLIRRLVALLNAGRGPAVVFGHVVRTTTRQRPAGRRSTPTAAWIDHVCAQVHAAAHVGMPVSVTLGRLARATPDTSDRELAHWARSVSTQLAACWEISERSGASLSRALTGLADSVESQLDARAARESALAGPRATVRVLAWLPVLALGLGTLMGTDPVTTLITTPWGRVALAAGAVLTVVGKIWTRQLLRHAEAVDGP